MAKYTIRNGEQVRTTIAKIATATAIELGDLVTLTAGLITKAAAASTAVALCTKAHAANSGTQIEVTVGNDFTMRTTGGAVFAQSYVGGEYDINDTTQTINFSGTSTKVLKVSISEDAGVVGSASGIEVRINKPLF